MDTLSKIRCLFSAQTNAFIFFFGVQYTSPLENCATFCFEIFIQKRREEKMLREKRRKDTTLV